MTKLSPGPEKLGVDFPRLLTHRFLFLLPSFIRFLFYQLQNVGPFSFFEHPGALQPGVFDAPPRCQPHPACLRW